MLVKAKNKKSGRFFNVIKWFDDYVILADVETNEFKKVFVDHFITNYDNIPEVIPVQYIPYSLPYYYRHYTFPQTGWEWTSGKFERSDESSKYMKLEELEEID